MIRKAILLFAGLLVLPGLAIGAGDLSYTNLEVDYINLSIDPFDEEGTLLEDFDDGNGGAVRGSFAFTPNIYGFGGYSIVDSEGEFVNNGTVLITSDRDVKRFEIGGGFNMPVFQTMATQTDFIGRFAYADIDFGDFDFGGGDDEGLDDLNDDTSDGFYVDGALRSQLTSWLEMSGGLRYTEIEESDTVSFIGNAMFELTPAWGLNLEVDLGDDISQVFVGARYSFDR
jgi:hypothetical protein